MKNLTRFILALLLIMAIGSVNAQTTLNVPGDYATIQAAINAANIGDIIQVAAGIYNETFTLNKDVTVRGPNYGVPGTGTRAPEAILNGKLTVMQGTIDGFRFEKSDMASYVGNAPIAVGGSGFATIRNNIFVSMTSGSGNNSYAGIEVQMGTGNKIIDNNYFTRQSGRRQWRSGMWVNSTTADFQIINNTFDNTNTALNMDYGHPGIVVEGNTFNSNNGTYVAFGGGPTGTDVWGENYFPGNPGSKFNLSNVATSFRFDVTACKFNGKTGADMTLTELFNFENGLSHRGAGGKNGLIIYKANHEFVRGTGVGNTIQSAVDYADPGFIINVYQGQYNEAVIINKDNLTFLGAQRDTDVSGRTVATSTSETKVSAPNNSGAAFGTTGAGAKNITINGFSIRGNNGGAGIEASGNVDNMHVEGNLFSGFANRLAFAPAAGSQDVVFTKNRVMSGSFGPYYPNSTSGEVSYNIINGMTSGTSADQGAAVILEGSGNDVQIINNNLSGNVTGIFVWDGTAGGTADLNNTLVKNNDLSDNDVYFSNGRNVTLNTACNWYGTAATPDPLKIIGNVNAGTYLDAGTSSTTLGFEPTGDCTGPVTLWRDGNLISPYATIADAYDVAINGDVIMVGEGTHQLIEKLTINKSITIQGQGRDNTILEISSTWFNDPNNQQAFDIYANNVTIQDLHFKVVGKGQGSILRLFGSDVDILNNKFSGEYEFGDGQVTRATEWSTNTSTNINFSNNIVESLRQPGYINQGSGIISNNQITGTRGWLIAETFSGTLDINKNSFDNNSSHLTILAGANLANVHVNHNSFGSILDWVIENRDDEMLDATCNWYGTTNETEIKAKIQGDIKYFPYKTDDGPDSCLEPSFELKVKIR